MDPSQSVATVAVVEVPVDRIRRDEAQARKDFDAAKLAELAASIKQVGVLEPLELRPDREREGQCIIVYGERRWRAAQIAGLDTVPAIVRDEPRSVRRRQLYENTMRVDLNAVELADNVAKLLQEEKVDTATLAEQLRWPLRKVQRLMEIHEAPEMVKSAIATGVDVDGARRVLPQRHALDVVRAFRHFAKADKSPTNEKALRRTEKLLQRVLVEEWSATRLQEFVAAIGRGKRIRDADLEVVRPQPKPAPGDQGLEVVEAASVQQSPIASAASLAGGAAPLFERSERRFLVRLDRACACVDPARRAELVRALRDLAEEVAGNEQPVTNSEGTSPVTSHHSE